MIQTLCWPRGRFRFMRDGVLAIVIFGIGSSASLGQKTLDQLVHDLGSEQLQDRRDAAWSIARFQGDATSAVEALIKATQDRDTQIANGALQALAQIGPPAEPAIPAILAQLESRDRQRRYRAAFAVGRIADPASQDLLDALTSESASLRAGILESIGWMGARAAPLIPAVVDAVHDTDDQISTAAQRALEQLGSQSVKPLLIALDAEGDDARRVDVVLAIGQLGPRARPALPQLMKLAESDSDVLSSASVDAIGRIAREPTDHQAAETVVAALATNRHGLHHAALQSIIRMPAAHTPASVDHIVAKLSDAPETARLAAYTLGRLGSISVPAVDDLIERLANDVRQADLQSAISRIGPTAIPQIARATREGQISHELATQVIKSMGPRANASVEALLESNHVSDQALALRCLPGMLSPERCVDLLRSQLASPTMVVRRAAVIGLGELQTRAKPAIPEMVALLDDEFAEVRGDAILAIASANGDVELLKSHLIDSLQDHVPYVRMQAAKASGTNRPIAGELSANLVAMLDDEHATVRRTVAATLSKEKQLPGKYADAFVATLDASDVDLVAASTEALGKMIPPSSSSVDTLARLTEHEAHMVQLAALESIERLGRHAKSARQHVGNLQTHSSPDVRIAAMDALSAMSEDKEKLKLLLAALADEDWIVRKHATGRLGDMGQRASSAVPRLLEFALTGDAATAEASGNALRQIDAAPPEAVPILVTVLEDPSSDRRARRFAIYLLRKSGAGGEPALPILRDIRDGLDARRRSFLDKTIREIERAIESRRAKS